MGDLVTNAELSDRIFGVTLADDDATAANAYIDDLEARMAGYLRRPLTSTTVTDEKHHIEPGDTRLLTKQGPVTGVTSITIEDSDPITSGIVFRSWGVDLWESNVSVVGETIITYTAGGFTDSVGENEVAAVVRQAALRDVLRYLTTSQGLERLSVDGGTSMSFDCPVGEFTEAELARVTPWRRRVVRSG